MGEKRKKIPMDVRKLVLHESGYKCANPVCRTVLTLDIHHIEHLADDGGDLADNLLALCPNCHAQYHRGIITKESVRTWKLVLLSLNEGFDKHSIDLLLALSHLGFHYVSGDGVLNCASLIAAGLIESTRGMFREDGSGQLSDRLGIQVYTLHLTEKGKRFVEGWKSGKQDMAVSPDP
jgi:hypothetical protein